jgi:CheY-like chemotaxis protein
MDQQKPFIIVVDDDDEDRYLLNNSFTEMGLHENVKFFSDALQFIKYTELIGSLNVKPSLIILDYKMPYMNGKAVVSYLKSKSPFTDIPVVILTEMLSEDIKIKLFELGVTACHQKGAGFDKLTAELREIVKFAIPAGE